MATLKTDVYLGQSSGNVGSRVTGNKVTGEVRYLTGLYTATGAEAAGDVVQIGQLPVGAIVLPRQSTVSSDGVGGTSATVTKLGDASTDNRYSATSIAITSAISSAVTPVAGIEASQYQVDSTTCVLQATLGLGSGSYTAGKKILFIIAFLMP